MPHVIIIGFGYGKGDAPLTSVGMDIYEMSVWSRNMGFSSVLITDVDRVDAMDNEVISNHQDLLEDTELVKTQGDFTTRLQEALQPHYILNDHLLVYYSGHGVREELILPDQTTYPWLSVRRAIEASVCLDVIFLLDCCHPSSLSLPFLYQIQGDRFFVDETGLHTRKKILLITSAQQDELSLSSANGSLFTRCLISILKKTKEILPYRDLLARLCTNIMETGCGHSQGVAIYASTQPVPVVSPWLLGLTDVEYQDGFLTVRRN